MRCVRRHLIFDKSYQIFINSQCMSIGKNEQNAKYLIKFEINTQVDWLMKKEGKNQTLEAFGIEYNGQTKWFNMNSEEIVKLFEILRTEVTFKNIQNMYTPIKLLGGGAFSKVVLVQNKFNHRLFANKCFQKNIHKKVQQHKFISSEIEVLKRLNHSNIVKFQEFYDCDIFYHLITEYVDGVNLSTYIKSFNTDLIPQEIIRQIMQQLLDILFYLNSNHIIHRDIKPDNIMIQDQNGQIKIKLIDFGFATYTNQPNLANTLCGTPGYMAPEIINQSYKNATYLSKCDIFSAGCIFFKLITKEYLFFGDNVQIIYNSNKQCKINKKIINAQKHVSQSAKNLLFRMLEIDPLKRISSSEALQHDFLTDQFTPTCLSTVFCSKSPLDCKQTQSIEPITINNEWIPNSEGIRQNFKIPQFTPFPYKNKNL